MPKKAVLVEFNCWIRTVVDIPEDMDVDSDEAFELIGSKAVETFRGNIMEDKDYPYVDNIASIEEDFEIPYGEAPEDKEK